MSENTAIEGDGLRIPVDRPGGPEPTLNAHGAPAIPEIQDDGDEFALGPTDRMQLRMALMSVANWEPRTTKNKYGAKELRRLLMHFGATGVESANKDQMIARLRLVAGELVEHEKTPPTKDDSIWSPPENTYDNNIEDNPDAKIYFGYRCLKCGRVALQFEPGFDPRQPGTDGGGNHLVFTYWRSRFLAWEHVEQYKLDMASRENPRCHWCNDRIPLFQGGRSLPARGIVAFKDFDMREKIEPLPAPRMSIDRNIR